MKDAQVTVLLENIDDKLESLAEVVDSIHERLVNVEQKVEAIPQIVDNIKTIKAVQTDQGREIRHIERYLTTQGMPSRA
ncbi:MAG TPA: hypothetical protein VF261_01215 [Candidatus Saccharimonadales bacterium]